MDYWAKHYCRWWSNADLNLITMIDISINEIESSLAGFPVAEIISDFSVGDIERLDEILHTRVPVGVVYCKVHARDLLAIHELSRLGFIYVETQLNLFCRLKPTADHLKFPYAFFEVKTFDELHKPIEMAETIFDSDRFSLDPMFGRDFSAKRFREYLLQSFANSNDRIFLMKDCLTNEVVSFSSIRDIGGGGIRLLIGGICRQSQGAGLGVIHDSLAFSEYHRLGYRTAQTTVSAVNYPVINLEIRHFKFRVQSTNLVLRKNCAK